MTSESLGEFEMAGGTVAVRERERERERELVSELVRE